MYAVRTYAIRVRQYTLVVLYSRWQIFRTAGGDISIGSTVDTWLACDVSVPVGDTSAFLRWVLGDDGSTCRFFFPFVVDIGRLYVGCTNFTFVEDGIFWDVDTVESAVVEDASVAEFGEWQSFDHFELAVDEDAAVTELDKVGQCGVLEDGAVGEAPTGAEASAFFYLSVFTNVPRCAL